MKVAANASLKRQFIFDKLQDGIFEIKWSIKSSIMPSFVTGWLPHDTIKILKNRNQVSIHFSVHKIKKLGYSRSPSILLFDFTPSDHNPDSLTNYNLYLIDEATKRICNLSKKFNLEEKKLILTAMITHKNKRVRQNEGDLFKKNNPVEFKGAGTDKMM